jgi:tRNA threonylcarbamoyladenosine biosynthesis protein TsaB
MLILALDTSTRVGSVAVLHDQTVLAEVVSCPGEPYSVSFFGDLEGLLAPLRLSVQQFDLFAVGAGPGSFTGLRGGLATVKAWSEIFTRPIAAVSCLEATASKIRASGVTTCSGTLIAPVLDARRGQIFGCLYRLVSDAGDLQPLTEEAVMTSDEFVEFVQGRIAAACISVEKPGEPGLVPEVVFVSPTPELIRPAIQCSNLAAARVEQVSGVLAGDIGRLGYTRALRGDVVDALRLDANYVRRPDAERNWKGKQES